MNKKFFQNGSGHRMREVYLAQLNEMTNIILEARDFQAILGTLADKLLAFLNADGCFITSWDSATEQSVTISTSSNLPFNHPEITFAPGENNTTLSVLSSGRSLIEVDVQNSPHINPRMVKQFDIHSILGIPLIVGDQKLGAVLIAFNAQHSFEPDEIDFAEQLCKQIAIAYWNSKQNSKLEQRLQESKALAKIGRTLSRTEQIGLQSVFQLIVDSARELIPLADQAVIHLVDEEEDYLVPKALSGHSDSEFSTAPLKMKKGVGIAGQVIKKGVTINIGDVQTDPRFLRSLGTPIYRSLLVSPIQDRGQRIGTISVASNQIKAFSNEEAELLESLGAQANIAIENTRLLETTQQNLKELNALYRITQELNTSLDSDKLLRSVVDLLHNNFGYYHVQIFQLDNDSGDCLLHHASGKLGRKRIKLGCRIPAGSGIVGYVAETGESFVTNNVDQVVFYMEDPLLPETKSEMTVPIRREQQVIGVLDIQQQPPHQFTQQDLQLTRAIADALAVALQRAELYDNLQDSLNQERETRNLLIQNERLIIVGRLLASVSHELNNPLQAIQNALYLLRDEQDLSEQGRKDLDIILSETERMTNLIDQLRTSYRPIQDGEFESVDLNEIVWDVYSLLATHLRHNKITFEFTPDSILPEISGLSKQLHQVVLNVFMNSIEAMTHGGKLSVWTHTLSEQNHILLSVQDTGPGIDHAILPTIFEAFFTTKSTGTGLGLAISRDIIRQHKGQIQAENALEGGAIINIWLPMEYRELE